MKRVLLASSLFTVMLFCGTAYAQGSIVEPVSKALTWPTAVMLILSLILGIATQCQQSGKLLGQWSISHTTMIGLTMLIPFLGGTITSFGQTGINAAGLFFAMIAGITNLLTASAPGIAVGAHFVVPGHMEALKKR